ncbi:MAG TPA: NAD(P)(+) transhydrogenase (Re/Si-specific) subunit beta [Nakamurella sp.]|jgi:NAD(P) transhydrogenase subunit beta|nr:NAD(P)(+) transhydrogenase (Re/Si-specific) subunit beta [Nakamurella sp.]
MTTFGTPAWLQLVDLFVAVCFVLALKGLSGPKTARNGNLLGAFAAVLAVVVLFVAYPHMNNLGLIIAAIAVGTLIGFPTARRVKMTAMPQLVALFNGVGGGAAALVAIIEFLGSDNEERGILAATVFTVVVGSISFTGSMLTFLKLQEAITTRPIVLPAGRFVTSAVGAGTLVAAVGLVVAPSTWLLVLLIVLAAIMGLLLVLPVGGADVPIIISLLNAFTGLSVAASGYVLGNVLLIVAGTLVGASGTMLTRAMAKAMGRPLTNTMFGAFTVKSTAGGAGVADDRPVRSSSAADVAIMLGYANKVIIVPGYGLAVAQAQHTLRELVDMLNAKGIATDYAIHPVAGRMPGHMNVLLAEANVPYEQLKEMDEINPEFASTDVVLVVGANDVVNPAAKTDPTAPIYGMPVLDVGESAQVVFLKRSMRPGFAGITNELLYDPKTTLLFGDAKDSLTKVVTGVKNL